jgi:hypothetical protein
VAVIQWSATPPHTARLVTAGIEKRDGQSHKIRRMKSAFSTTDNTISPASLWRIERFESEDTGILEYPEVANSRVTRPNLTSDR